MFTAYHANITGSIHSRCHKQVLPEQVMHGLSKYSPWS